MKPLHILLIIASLFFVPVLPMPALAQADFEQRISSLEHKTAGQHEGAGVAVFVCAAFCALWAQNTGRNPWLWFFLGLFFSVIVIFVLLYKNSQEKKLITSSPA